MQVLAKYLTLESIMCLLSTCKLMHNEWITKNVFSLLNIGDKIEARFKWAWADKPPLSAFRKKITRSLISSVHCSGGCGKKFNKKEDQDRLIMPRIMFPYATCATCAGVNEANSLDCFMRAKGYIRRKDLLKAHRYYLNAGVRYVFGYDINADATRVLHEMCEKDGYFNHQTVDARWSYSKIEPTFRFRTKAFFNSDAYTKNVESDMSVAKQKFDEHVLETFEEAEKVYQQRKRDRDRNALGELLLLVPKEKRQRPDPSKLYPLTKKKK